MRLQIVIPYSIRSTISFLKFPYHLVWGPAISFQQIYNSSGLHGLLIVWQVISCFTGDTTTVVFVVVAAASESSITPHFPSIQNYDKMVDGLAILVIILTNQQRTSPTLPNYHRTANQMHCGIHKNIQTIS